MLAAAVAFTSCSKKELHLFTWADYVKPELVQKFEQEHGCHVVIDTFDSNESMYAKLQSGAHGYDIVVPSTYMAELMQQQGMLEKLDHSRLPHLKEVDEAILSKIQDSKMEYAVPYALSYGVLGYRKDKVQDAKPTWAMLEDARLKQKTSLLNDTRETLGAALKFLGHSVNTTNEQEIAAAGQVVMKWKANAVKFDNEQYKGAVDAGEFYLVHGYSGDLYQAVVDNPQVGILVPAEGVVIACDQMVIPKGAASAELAHQFIDFLLQPEVAAENMEWMGYSCPNKGGLKKVTAEFLANPAIAVPPEILAKSEVIKDLGNDRAKYNKVWDQIKASN